MIENNILNEKDEDKKLYLIRTLSRTKRKDYENYVINAIWHKIGNNNLEVVSQQYVEDKNNKDRSHYFIDLYFPSLNIGIECDEAHHETQVKEDKEREVSIFDILYELKSDKGFKLIRIDVSKSFDDLTKSIDDAVEIIKQKIGELNPPKWTVESAETYYKEKDRIAITDRKGFSSIRKTCNVLFNTKYNEKSNGASSAYFTPNTFKGTDLAEYKVWFPQLAIKTKEDNEIKDENEKIKSNAATSSGWNNQLIDNGETIIEYNEKNKTYNQVEYNRIVFAKYKDPLSYNEYKFVGIFELDVKKDGKAYFKRVAKECILLK